MLYWSIKTLAAEPLRMLLSAAAVAAALILVVFFSAVFEGESEQMVAYLEQMDADVWVMQKGVSNMHMASSMLWDWKADKVSQVPGVRSVSPVLYLNGPVKIGGRDWFSYLIGITPKYSRAGPWSMARGRAVPSAGEAVIPETIARLTGVRLGDEITLIDRQLRIVGLSRGTFSMASSVVFVSRTDLGELLESPDQYSYIMVYAELGVDAQSLVQRIEDHVDKVNALTSDRFIESDRQLALQMGAEIIRLMTIIGMLLAMLIVAFSTISIIARNRRQLAVAKALGCTDRQVYAAALTQSMAISVLGLVFAMLIAFTILTWLPEFVPQINLSVRVRHFIPVALLTLPVAVLASLGSALTVTWVDPVAAFRS